MEAQHHINPKEVHYISKDLLWEARLSKCSTMHTNHATPSADFLFGFRCSIQCAGNAGITFDVRNLLSGVNDPLKLKTQDYIDETTNSSTITISFGSYAAQSQLNAEAIWCVTDWNLFQYKRKSRSLKPEGGCNLTIEDCGNSNFDIKFSIELQDYNAQVIITTEEPHEEARRWHFKKHFNTVSSNWEVKNILANKQEEIIQQQPTKKVALVNRGARPACADPQMSWRAGKKVVIFNNLQPSANPFLG